MKGEKMIEKIKESVLWLEKRAGGFKPEILIITGSGLANAMPELENPKVIPYGEIPNFPRTTVKGHKGELVLGEYAGRKLAVMRGRFHFYEGHDMSFISFPIRLLNTQGAKKLIVTAAVGSLKKSAKPGELMILKDHINLMGGNPLIGNHSPSFGEMFVDMAEPYKKSVVKKLLEISQNLKIDAQAGVYLAVSGPAYETESEVRMYAVLGGDVVGMSVVPEVISARQLKMDVCGITWISNFTTGISEEAFDHAKVLEMGQEAGARIKKLIEGLLKDGAF